MKIASLGSGSSGNATLVDSGQGLILIDCGFSAREVERRLERLGQSLLDLAAILVTHEHSDHLSGVAALARRCQLPVFLTRGTSQRLQGEAGLDLRLIRADEPFELLGLRIYPVPVPHDAREPVQFVLQSATHKLGVLTDLGCLTEHIKRLYRDCQVLLVEANHDLDMLMSGPYPESLKRRVGGRWGHLNNQQTADFLRAVNEGGSLRTLVIGHISRHNNAVERVRQAVEPVTAGIDQIHYALQDETLAWVSCHNSWENPVA